MTRSRILKPNLRHSFAQPRYLCDPLKVLAIGVGVQVEIGLKYLQLFFGKCRSNALRLCTRIMFLLSIFIGGLAAWIDKLLKVRFAKHASIMQCKLFTRAQLSSALFAGKARQMINTVASSPNPVCRLDPPSALCAPRTELRICRSPLNDALSAVTLVVSVRSHRESVRIVYPHTDTA